MKVSYLDCCSDPELESVKTILDTNRESEGLVRCKTCGSYWYQRFLEIMKFDGPDDQTTWSSPVTEEEAQYILKAESRPDLKFLLSRPSFVEDANGIRHVSGQPDRPCYG